MPNCVFEIFHSSSIWGSSAPFIAKTEKANCEHSTNTKKFIRTARDEKTGVVLFGIVIA
jgi:hypothetical protein